MISTSIVEENHRLRHHISACSCHPTSDTHANVHSSTATCTCTRYKVWYQYPSNAASIQYCTVPTKGWNVPVYENEKCPCCILHYPSSHICLSLSVVNKEGTESISNERKQQDYILDTRMHMLKQPCSLQRRNRVETNTEKCEDKVVRHCERRRTDVVRDIVYANFYQKEKYASPNGSGFDCRT